MTELWNLCCSQGHHAHGTRASRAGQGRWHSASITFTTAICEHKSWFWEIWGAQREEGWPPAGGPAHPQHQHPHVCHSQVDLGALAVAGGVQTDPVHLQLPGHVQQLNVRLGRRLPSGDTNMQEATGARGQMLKWAGKCHFVGARAGITASPAC